MSKSRKPNLDLGKSEKRDALFVRLGVVAVLVVIAVGIGTWAVLSNRSSVGEGSQPTVATAEGAFRVTSAPAGTEPKAVLTVFEDFQCPACQQFEMNFGATLAELAEIPEVAIDYRPIAILDGQSADQYSTRSANASACVAEATAQQGDFTIWRDFHDSLYTQQPSEGGAGLSDGQLNRLAQDAGSPNVNECITNRQYGDWVAQGTSNAASEGVTGTPTVKLNGEQVELSTPDELAARVREAAEAA